VTLLPAGGCDLGALRFDQFALSAQGQNGFNAALFIGGAPFTNLTAEQTSGGQATLGFQVAHQPAPMNGLGDILLSYRASTLSGDILLGGINLANGGVGPVTIHERVCGTKFTATGACTTLLLADLLVTANSFADVRFKPGVDVHEIFILKDILIGDGGFISDFSNSHELGAVPEPATMLLLGSTFAGLAAYARRKRALGAPAGIS
jgi:PEP-CTERM motif-containing protein